MHGVSASAPQALRGYSSSLALDSRSCIGGAPLVPTHWLNIPSDATSTSAGLHNSSNLLQSSVPQAMLTRLSVWPNDRPKTGLLYNNWLHQQRNPTLHAHSKPSTGSGFPTQSHALNNDPNLLAVACRGDSSTTIQASGIRMSPLEGSRVCPGHADALGPLNSLVGHQECEQTPIPSKAQEACGKNGTAGSALSSTDGEHAVPTASPLPTSLRAVRRLHPMQWLTAGPCLL